MKYKKMVVWSGGSKNAVITKIHAIMFGICFVLSCILHVTSFICNPYDDKTIPVTLGDHILFGIIFIALLGWLTASMLGMSIMNFKAIKTNKLISLYLYKIEEFAKIKEIPENKFILFSDERGIVLADKKHECESRTFSFGAKYFYDFEKYYDKHAVEKMEICENALDTLIFEDGFKHFEGDTFAVIPIEEMGE